MAPNLSLLRTLGIAAAALGSVQALTWGILSLLGILVYSDAINWTASEDPLDNFQNALVIMYFKRNDTVFGVMSPTTVVIWMSVYLTANVLWLVISGFLLYDSYNSKFTYIIIQGWVFITAVYSGLDVGGAVTFGLDYNAIKTVGPDTVIADIIQPFNATSSEFGTTDILLAPIFMMTMCVRGFTLWIINMGLATYLTEAAKKLKKKEDAKLTRQPSVISLYSSMRAKLYHPPKEGSSIRERQNPAFQPDALHAWDIQSPTMGNQQRSPWNFPENSSPNLNDVVNPTKLPPRVAKPVATPVAPLPIPQPDYSPPLGRPVRHEPNLYEIPGRSVLKKPNPTGRTVF